MVSFALAAIPAIRCVADGIDILGSMAATYAPAGPVLLVLDPGLPASVGERAGESLRASHFEPLVFRELESDPKVTQADAAAAMARDAEVRLVIAIGGGSALDVGKTAAVVARDLPGTEAYALCARPLPARALPTICVPTTAGTGSETTRTAVLSDATGRKLWLWGDTLKASAVLLDPALSVSLPPALTASSGIDALVHAIEACTNRHATPAGDLFCHEAIGLVCHWLPRAMRRPDDLEARAGMLWAASLAGIGIDNAGTGVAHAIGHALGSLCPIPHGRAVGLAMLATLEWNTAPGGRAWRGVAELMGGPVQDRFAALAREVGLDRALAECDHAGITPEALAAQMRMPENEPMLKANGREVGDDDLIDLARLVLGRH